MRRTKYVTAGQRARPSISVVPNSKTFTAASPSFFSVSLRSSPPSPFAPAEDFGATPTSAIFSAGALSSVSAPASLLLLTGGGFFGGGLLPFGAANNADASSNGGAITMSARNA